MVKIRNLLGQRLNVHLTGSKNVDLPAKSSIEVSEKELSSQHLQTLISRGDVMVMKDVEPKIVKAERLGESKKAEFKSAKHSKKKNKS